MSKKPTPTGRVRGKDLIVTRSFKAPIEDVWESVTKSERTERWFGRWEGTPGAGNTIRFLMVFEKGDAWQEAVIDTCDAPRHLELTSKGEYGAHMELKLREDNGTTHLEFVHHLKDGQSAGDYGPGWEYYFDNLVAYRAGEQLPVFEDYYPSQKEYFLAQVT